LCSVPFIGRLNRDSTTWISAYGRDIRCQTCHSVVS
jgi:hypothetical protein